MAVRHLLVEAQPPSEVGPAWLFAKRLDLITVSWLFEKLIDYFIIFFVVIFQQDIRRALMQVGQNLFMRRQYEETYVIEEVVQAAGELAKQRTGALIVIGRMMPGPYRGAQRRPTARAKPARPLRLA